MKLSRVHHVSINVDDLEKATPFYTEVLGLRVLPRPDFGIPGCWLDAGEQQVHLIEVKEHEAPKGQHFAFEVEDLDATLEALSARGAEPSAAFEIPDVGRQAFLHDPAGNMIEFNQPKR